MTKHYFNRQVIIQVHDNGKIYQFKAFQQGNTFSIHFTVPFDDSGKPATSTVTIMNLSLQHRMLFSVGNQVEIFAGYAENTGPQLLTTGLITVVNPYQYDGVDGQFTFNVREGGSYNSSLPSSDVAALISTNKSKSTSSRRKKRRKKKKVKTKLIANAISFGKNITAKAIINRVAKDANINISKLKLPTNKKYTKGYVAKGIPMDTITKVADDCDAKPYYRRGHLYIEKDDPSNAINEHVYLSDRVGGTHGGSGLIAVPTVTSDDTPQIEVKSVLLPQISTNSLIAVDAYQFNFIRPVKSGQHNCDDDDFSTTMECDIA